MKDQCKRTKEPMNEQVSQAISVEQTSSIDREPSVDRPADLELRIVDDPILQILCEAYQRGRELQTKSRLQIVVTAAATAMNSGSHSTDDG